MTKSGTSHNYRIANEDPQKGRTCGIASSLGVSEAWVRKHIPCHEWHHCYGKYGDYARAFFYTLPEVAEFLFEPAQARLTARLFRRNPEAETVLKRWIANAAPTAPLLSRYYGDDEEEEYEANT